MPHRIKQSLRKQFSHVQNILFALEDNAIHQRSKPEDPSTESPQQFGSPIDNPHRHHQKEKAVPHQHTGDNKSKA
jgi:hypothetical protein